MGNGGRAKTPGKGICHPEDVAFPYPKYIIESSSFSLSLVLPLVQCETAKGL